MKSFTIFSLIFLTLVSVESDGINGKSNNNTINYTTNTTATTTSNSSSLFTKNTLSTNIHNNFNTSTIDDSYSSATFRDKRDTNFALDQSEIARQNQITQQILSNYLERRLFPYRSVNQKIPTIAEILPKPKPPTVRPKPRGFATSSASYKRGAAKQSQRKIYGNRHKNRNSLLQRNKQKPTAKPHNEDDYDEVETEKNINNNSSRKSENNNNNNHNINNDFVDDVVVDDVEDEPVEEDLETKQKQQQNYQHHLLLQRQLHRHHYRYLEDKDDLEPDGQESLQSVESEQHDHYYNSNGSNGNNILSSDPRENEIDSGNLTIQKQESAITTSK